MPVRQESFAYTREQVDTLVRAISLKRLVPYLQRTRNDKWLAIQIYNQNTELSKDLYGTLQVLEVLLRNVIHRTMTKAMNSSAWYFELPLKDAELRDIQEAEEGIGSGQNSSWLIRRNGGFIRVGEEHFLIEPDRVVAALSFGFWVKLCSPTYEQKIWPHLEPYWGRHSRGEIHGRLSELKQLRNRVAHHETLIKRNRELDQQQLLETIGWLSPTLQEWAQSQSQFLDILNRPLPKRPKPLVESPVSTEGEPTLVGAHGRDGETP